jgi:hypothetical protein
MAASEHDLDRSVTVRELLRQPAGFLPIVMSLGALAMVVWYIAAHGAVQQPDEGAQAHLWQLLVAGQIPFAAYVAAVWLRRAPAPAVNVLLLQVLAVLLLAVAPLWILGGL